VRPILPAKPEIRHRLSLVDFTPPATDLIGEPKSRFSAFIGWLGGEGMKRRQGGTPPDSGRAPDGMNDARKRRFAFVPFNCCPGMTSRKRSHEPLVKRQRAVGARPTRRAPNSPPRARGRGAVIEDLALAQKHVIESELRVRQQRELVAKQAARGDDTSLSERLLARLEDVLSLHMSDRDRLIAEPDTPAHPRRRAPAKLDQKSDD
jgi:hypothetical protein